MTTKIENHGELTEEIERLVREYISTVRMAARGAVERAIAAGASGGASPKAMGPRVASAATRRVGKRRAADEIAALGERFYEVLCRSPGETMTILAPIVGASPRELNRSTILLKRGGRIRSVGTRQATRYFPMAPRS